jgi:hypothetical protein
MPSIQKNNRAGELLGDLREEDRLSLDRLALLIGASAADLRACRDQQAVLPPATQLRLARAIATRVPRLLPRARRLEEQALAAARVEDGSNVLHLTAPAKWW